MKDNLTKCVSKWLQEFYKHKKGSRCSIQRLITNRSSYPILLNNSFNQNSSRNGCGWLNVRSSKRSNGQKDFCGLKSNLSKLKSKKHPN